MNNYSEITASTETEIDHSSSSDPSVSESKFSHFVTKSPAMYKKQGDYDIENIYRYTWFKINEKQSLEMNCNDCNTARIFETVLLLVQIILTTGECARGT